jgi:hypothetical protein
MSDVMDEHKAAMRLVREIRKAMGKHYDTRHTCVYNVQALVKKIDGQGFQSPGTYYRNRDNGQKTKL